MTARKIEEILANEEELIPSSGFASSVMDRIGEEASAPPPIPFPWKRAIPGIALIAGVFGWGVIALVRLVFSAGFALPHSATVSPVPLNEILDRPFHGAGWLALSLVVAWLSWAFSRRLAGRSGLL